MKAQGPRRQAGSLRVLIVGLCIALIGSAAAAQAASPAPLPSLYDRLGGKTAIAAVVADALGRIATDARINRHFHGIALGPIQGGLVDLLCLRTGGPCAYTGRDMAAAHEGMFIRDDEFDALVDDIAQALDHFKVPERDKREALALAWQTRGAIVGH